MRTGQARKRDTNEPEIVRALQDIGVIVCRLSGAGLPDLLTFSRGVWLPVEVKMPHGLLTPEQTVLYLAAPFPVVRSVAEALSLFGVNP